MRSASLEFGGSWFNVCFCLVFLQFAIHRGFKPCQVGAVIQKVHYFSPNIVLLCEWVEFHERKAFHYVNKGSMFFSSIVPKLSNGAHQLMDDMDVLVWTQVLQVIGI